MVKHVCSIRKVASDLDRMPMSEVKLIVNSRTNKPLMLAGSVALIGNSDRLAQEKNGNNIDRYDHVFRFNLAPTGLTYQSLVGLKTDFYFLSQMITTFRHQESSTDNWVPFTAKELDEFRSICRKNKVICYPGHSKNILPLNKRPYLIVAELNDINSIFYNFLGHSKWFFSENNNPRNGIKLIACLLAAGIKPNLYGFDIEERESNSHYFDDEVQEDYLEWGHMPSIEYRLLKELGEKELLFLH